MPHITTPEWVKDAVFYQIFPDRFAQSTRMNSQELKLEEWNAAPTPNGFKGGNLFGVLEKLDYLQDLGINAIYFNPIFSSASNHRYHTYDYFNVDPLLGGNLALRELIDECHKRGMRIVLDGVFNHASRGFWQFHHVLETGDGSPYVDWFYFDPERLMGRKAWGAYPGNHEMKALKSGAGSFDAIGYQAWWDLPALPKFNTSSPAVRSFIFSVAEFWLKFGIDGWRLDVPAEINDDEFWREFRRRVKTINPDAYIVGEIWQESKRWLQGDQFDAVMNYPVTIAEMGFFCGDHLDVQEASRAGGFRDQIRHFSAEEFSDEINRILNWYDPQITQVQLNLLDSHDTPRFITCARGDQASLRLAWLFMFTYPGAPCIYYGDEIGMEGRQDPDCRRSFPPNPQDWDMDLLRYAKSLIALRHDHPALRRGVISPQYAKDGVYAYARTLAEENLLIALNASNIKRTISIPLGNINGCELIIGQASIHVMGETLKVELEPRTGVVVTF
jgi:cyclomaltodextrinase / maltogenic alpha-amylase / neopullulanase